MLTRRAILRSYSAAQAEKKADREIPPLELLLVMFMVNATMGAIIVLGCETDFVANNPEFRAMANDIAMHVCAMAPSDEAELWLNHSLKTAN